MPHDFATTDIAGMFDQDDFGSVANVTRASQADLVGISVILDRQVESVLRDGVTVERRDIMTFKASDLDEYTEGDVVVIGSESWRMQEELANDGLTVDVFVRQITS